MSRSAGGDRRSGRRTGVNAAALFDQVVDMVAAGNGILLSADNYTPSGADVATFVDNAKPSRTFAITGTLPIPTAHASFNNALVAAPTGTQFGVCSEAASLFAWMHNNPQWQVHVYQDDGAADQFIWATGLTSTSICMRFITGAVNTTMTLQNGLGGSLTNSIASVLNTSTYSDFQYAEPGTPNDVIHRRKGTVISSVDTAFAPSGSAPGATLGLFRRALNAGLEFSGLWAMSMAVPMIPTAQQRSLMQSMILAKYGQAA